MGSSFLHFFNDSIENITEKNKINQVKTNLKHIKFIEHGQPFFYPRNTAAHHHRHFVFVLIVV